jgi:hypothetical protein
MFHQLALGRRVCFLLSGALLVVAVSLPARSEEPAAALPPAVFDFEKLSQDPIERKTQATEQWQAALPRMQEQIAKLQKSEELTAEEYAEFDAYYQMTCETQGVFIDENYLLNFVGIRCALPLQVTDYEQHAERLKKWRERSPQSPAPPALLARLYMQWAWVARGNGFAATVGKTEAELFQDRMREARFYCEEAAERADNDPSIYLVRIKVAQAIGESKNEVYELLRKARQAGDYYLSPYEAAAEYLLPRWHGQPGDCEELAVWAKRELGGELGIEAYGRIARMVNCYDLETIYVGGYTESELLEAGQFMAAKYPESNAAQHFALLTAYVAQDRAAVKKGLEAVTGEFPPYIWHFEGSAIRVANWLEQSTDKPLHTKTQKWLTPSDVYGPLPCSDTSHLFYQSLDTMHLLYRYDSHEQKVEPIHQSPYGELTRFVMSRDATCLAVLRDSLLGSGNDRPTEGAGFVLHPGSEKAPVELQEMPGRFAAQQLFGGGKFLALIGDQERLSVWNTTTGEVELRAEDFQRGERSVRRFYSNDSSSRMLLELAPVPQSKEPQTTSFEVFDAAARNVVTTLSPEELLTLNLPGIDVRHFDGDSLVYFSGHQPGPGKPTRKVVVELNLATRQTRQLHEINAAEFPANIAISGDGTLLLVSNRSPQSKTFVAELIDLKSGQNLARFDMPSHGAPHPGFMEGSQKVFAKLRGRIYLWDVEQLRKGIPEAAAAQNE